MDDRRYDGGLRPPLISELEQDGLQMPEEGLLFVGDKGKMYVEGWGGHSPRLIPEATMKASFRMCWLNEDSSSEFADTTS